MHRFYFPDSPAFTDDLTLTGNEATHAVRVLRVKPGEVVTVLDGKGTRRQTVVERVSRACVRLRVEKVEKVHPPRVQITLYQAVTKPRSMDWIVEKATELGVARLQPVLTNRVVMRLTGAETDRKTEKWRRTSIEALKQCGGAWLPVIKPAGRIDSLLPMTDPNQPHLLASLSPAAQRLRSCLPAILTQANARSRIAVGVWIGPEGDFTLDETRLLLAQGATPITLGSRILRSDTAAVSMLTLVIHELEWLLGGSD